MVRIKIGQLTGGSDGSGNFGIQGFAANATDTVFKLGEDGNEIAGWTMTTSSISNGQVELSSALPGLIIDNETNIIFEKEIIIIPNDIIFFVPNFGTNILPAI